MSESIIVGSPINPVTTETPAANPVAIPAEGAANPPAGAVNAPAPAKTLGLGKAQERPAWLPAEYKTPEDFAKGHAELRAKLSGKPEDQKNLVSETDLQGYMQEVVGSGSLSDTSRRSLRAKGFTDALIDQHVMGLQAMRENQMNKMFTVAGGAESFQKMAEWAGTSFSAEERASYDAAVNSGNPQIVEMAIRGLKARYELSGAGVATPTERPAPTRLSGGAPSGATGMRMFATMQEQVRAQTDPRYATDANYRKAVEDMIDASIKAGKY